MSRTTTSLIATFVLVSSVSGCGDDDTGEGPLDASSGADVRGLDASSPDDSGSPADAVKRVASEVAKAVASPDFRERLANMGATPVGSSPEDFSRFLRAENVRWANAVKASGAKLD